MTRDEIIQNVQNIFRDVFDDDSIVIKDSTTARDIEGWDSLAQITLLMAMEKDFNIEFSLQDLESMSNVGDTITIIENYLKT
jgi:acyl carrier protein